MVKHDVSKSKKYIYYGTERVEESRDADSHARPGRSEKELI